MRIESIRNVRERVKRYRLSGTRRIGVKHIRVEIKRASRGERIREQPLCSGARRKKKKTRSLG